MVKSTTGKNFLRLLMQTLASGAMKGLLRKPAFDWHDFWQNLFRSRDRSGSSQHGESRAWVSELPHTASRMIYVLSSQCIPKRSITIRGYFFKPVLNNRGVQASVRMSYGLGSSNENLPMSCVLISNGTGRPGSQPVTPNCDSGFLPSLHQGVQFRGGKTLVFT